LTPRLAYFDELIQSVLDPIYVPDARYDIGRYKGLLTFRPLTYCTMKDDTHGKR
jgi:hypothetical protein